MHKMPRGFLSDSQVTRDLITELMPFLQVTISHTANIHLSMPSGESSKMLATLTVNCFLQPLQNQNRRVLMIGVLIRLAAWALDAIRPT